MENKVLPTMSISYSSIVELLQSNLSSPLAKQQSIITSRCVKERARYCGVCGDVTKSYHFGGLCCNSCKSFFRRSIKNDNYLHFSCSHQGRCVLSLSNRKNCRYCRMSRCFAIGMDKGWLWTEEERLASLQNRTEKKRRTPNIKVEPPAPIGQLLFSFCFPLELPPARQHQQINQPKVEHVTDFLTPLEIKEIESIINKYSQAYHSVPYRNELLHSLDPLHHKSGVQVMEMFGTSILRFHHFSQLLADFSSLPFQDQNNLLRGGILEMCLLRLALIYDPINNCWPNRNLPMYRDSPVLYLSDISRLTSPHLHQLNVDFIYWVQRNGLDEPTIMLLVLVVLFTPERAGIIWKEGVEKCQLHYTTLLERYMKWRYGLDEYRSLFGKLLTKLSDLRELSDSHDLQNLRLGNEEIVCIQSQLQHLKINPFYDLISPSTDLNIWNCSVDRVNDCNRSYNSTFASDQPNPRRDNIFPGHGHDSDLEILQPFVNIPHRDNQVETVDNEVSLVSQMIDEKVAFFHSRDSWMSSMDSSSNPFWPGEPAGPPSGSINQHVLTEEVATVSCHRDELPSPRTMTQLFEEIDQFQFGI